MGGPVRIDIPFILRVQGQTSTACGQITVKIAERILAVTQAAGALFALIHLQLQAADQVVFFGNQQRVFGAAVPGGIGLHRILRQGQPAIGPATLQGVRIIVPGAAAQVVIDQKTRAIVHASAPTRTQSQHGKAVVAGRIAQCIGQDPAALGECAAGLALVVAHDQHRRKHQAVAARAAPLPSPVGMQHVALALRARHFLHGLQNRGRLRPSQAFGHRGFAFVVSALHARGRQSQTVGHAINRIAARPGSAGSHFTVLQTGAHTQVVEVFDIAAPRDDVDGAGNRSRTGLGGGRAHDFDALHLLGRDIFQGKAARRALAINHDLCVAAAQTPHGRWPAAPGPAAAGNAG